MYYRQVRRLKALVPNEGLEMWCPQLRVGSVLFRVFLLLKVMVMLEPRLGYLSSSVAAVMVGLVRLSGGCVSSVVVLCFVRV